MRDDLLRLSTMGRIFRRRWRLLTVLTILGALVGAGVSVLFSPGYVTSANVVLQGPREPDELRTEAQLAVSTVVLGRAAEALGLQATGATLKGAVSASPGNGNVIQIQTNAGTPGLAKRLADQVANEYVAYSSQLISKSEDASAQVLQEQQQTLRRQVEQTNNKISELHDSLAGDGTTVENVQTRTQLEGLRTSLSQAIKVLGESETASSTANMVVLGPAEPAHEGNPTRAQFIGGGALVFFLLGFGGHLIAARRDKGMRDESDIAAVLGTSVLAGIDLPDEPSTGYAQPKQGSLHRILFGAAPWHLPDPPAAGDEHGRVIRYRRVLARLRTDGELRVMLLLAADDPVAQLAAAQLAVAAAAQEPTTVVTDDDAFAQLLRTAQDRAGAESSVLLIQAGSDPRPLATHTVLRVVDYSATQPIAPDDETTSGVLVLVASGSRTGWELANLAAACADAAQPILGTVVLRRTMPIRQSKKDAAPPVQADADTLAGTA